MNLNSVSLQPGQVFEIVNFVGDEVLRERLHEMGLRIGMQFKVLGRAPFGGPLLIRFNTSFLALRSEEVACAQVKLSPA
ncbi:MAG: FeoA family protein [Bdellovibrio sp.]